MVKTGKKWMRDAWKERADPSVMTCSQVIATQEAYASLVWKIQVSALKVPSLRSDVLAATSQLSLDRDEQLPVQSSAFLRWWVGPPSIRKEMVLSSGQLTSHSPGHCLLLSPHSPTLPAPTMFDELSPCCCPRARLATPRFLGLSSNSSNHPTYLCPGNLRSLS